jgi:hypothetical protein
VAFAVIVECPDEKGAVSGTAYVGGWWLVPFFSSRVDYVWDSGAVS